MIRAASVGLGRWGKTLANATKGSSKIRVTKVTSRTLAGGAEFAKEIGAEVVKDYERVLADSEVDAVILATPHSLHLEQIEQAAAAGKHVFVEKPITLTASDAQRAYDAATAAGVVLAVGFNLRFHPNHQRLDAMVRSGRLGQIVLVEATIDSPGLWNYAPTSWRSKASETPGGGMTGSAIHCLDQMIAMIGPIAAVTAQTAKLIKKGELDEVTAAIMTFSSGPIAYISTSLATCAYYNFRVFGENGCAEIRNRDLSEFVFTPRQGQGEPEHHVVHSFDKERAELEAFADAASGGNAYPVTAEEGIHGIAVMDAVVRSAIERRPTEP